MFSGLVRWADRWADWWAGRLIVSPRFSPCFFGCPARGPIGGPIAFLGVSSLTLSSPGGPIDGLRRALCFPGIFCSFQANRGAARCVGRCAPLKSAYNTKGLYSGKCMGAEQGQTAVPGPSAPAERFFEGSPKIGTVWWGPYIGSTGLRPHVSLGRIQ